VTVEVLDPSLMPFVDSPEAGGLDPDGLTSLLADILENAFIGDRT
jgi:arginase family enzyme